MFVLFTFITPLHWKALFCHEQGCATQLDIRQRFALSFIRL
jgi:hypothetical protein